MLNYIYRSYKIIDEVLRKGAFSSIELSHALNVAAKEDRAKITKIVYGVLENSVKYDYIISMLCDKKPKKSVLTLLKTGMFCYTKWTPYQLIRQFRSAQKLLPK